MRVQSEATLRLADATSFVAEQLAGAEGALTVLGAFPTAVYLQLPASEVVLAVLSADAVRLPIGLVLAEHSSRLSLACITEARLQRGELVLPGLRVRAGTTWSAALGSVGRPRRSPARPDASRIGLPAALLATLGTAAAAAVPDLIGRGPGLTPAGDDLLCGLLAGCVLFDVAADDVAQAVLDTLASRPRATTSLSRALLHRAVAGEGIPQLSSLAEALCSTSEVRVAPAWDALCAVGHSSGTALGLGLLAAADRADVSTMSKAG